MIYNNYTITTALYLHLAYRSKFFETIKSTCSSGAKGGAQEKWNKPCFPDEVHDGHSGDNDVDIMVAPVCLYCFLELVSAQAEVLI